MISLFFKKRPTKEQMELQFQKQLINDEVNKAKQALEVAQSQFHNCTNEYFDVANRQLTIAKEKLDLAIVKSKIINNVS